MAHRWKVCNNQELVRIFIEIKNEARRLGYPIDDLKLYNLYMAKSTRWWGQSWYENGRHSIVINETFLTNPQAARNTLIHEIAHALTQGDHHGKKWEKCGNAIGAKWGETVVRCSNHEGVESPGANAVYKYELQCTKCKHVYKYQRLSNAVKYPNAYLCSHCNTRTLTRIK